MTLPSLTSLAALSLDFESLSTVGGSLLLESLPSLTTLAGFATPATIAGSLVITNDVSLLTCNGKAYAKAVSVAETTTMSGDLPDSCDSDTGTE